MNKDKAKWILTVMLLGTILLSACNAQPNKSTPVPSSQSVSINSLTEDEVIDSAKLEIKKLTQQDSQVFWHTIQGDNVFSVAYTTVYDPNKAPKEFIEEFNKVVLISAKWFVQGKTKSPMMIVFAELLNSPATQTNPPLREVVVEKEKGIEWLNGKMTKDKFIDSWLVVPLPSK